MMEGPVKPNIYSWNIFMQAFFKMGQVQAAERVFDIMRDRGVDPDQFTWGVLLRGYAKSQLVDRIGDTLPHLEAERELDPDLLRHFARVVDRRKLMVTLEENKLQKEASARDKADQEAEEERSRWQPPQFELADVEAATTSNATSVQPDATGSSVLQKLTSRTEEQSGLLQDQPSALPSSTKPPRVLRSQPRSQRANLQDPEVQYRKLQEQLGLVEPAVSIVNDDVDSALIESSSTGPVFKSMIGKGKEKLKVADSGKPATTRKRPRFNLAKPKGGGDLR
jgi:pentatricopeptide repeat protein